MRTLAARLARGDHSAFAELYDACADAVHRYAAMRLGSADAANDVVQTAFMRAVKSRRRFREVEDPAAYVFEIVRNETARAAAKAARRRESPLPATDLWGADAQQAGGVDAEIVGNALAHLTDVDREIVEFKIYGGMTFAEISARIQRPPATVATRYRRALETLRGWLERQLRKK